MIPALPYWFTIPAAVVFFGGLLALYFDWQGMSPEQRAQRPKKFIAFALIYILVSCYLLAKQNQNAALDKKVTQDQLNRQTILFSDSRSQSAMLYAIMREIQNQVRIFSKVQSSQGEVVTQLRSFVEVGEEIQADGMKTNISLDDYKKERDKWLSEIRYFLLTNRFIQENEKWKDWAGGNGCDESFDCRDDMTELDSPAGCPDDRKDYFRDNSRRINNLKHFIAELAGK